MNQEMVREQITIFMSYFYPKGNRRIEAILNSELEDYNPTFVYQQLDTLIKTKPRRSCPGLSEVLQPLRNMEKKLNDVAYLKFKKRFLSTRGTSRADEDVRKVEEYLSSMKDFDRIVSTHEELGIKIKEFYQMKNLSRDAKINLIGEPN